MRTPESRASLRPRRHRTLLWTALAVAGCAGSAQAARLNYQVELTALHSDNINLSEDSPVSETVIIPRLSFDVKEQGAALELQARGMLERRHYLRDRFADETRGEFAGQLNWALMPERLHLVVEDYLSEEPINFRDGRYPGNLQEVNVFIAGPSYFARLGSATRFQLDLRGADSHAETSEGFDGQRYSASGVLQREFSAAASGSLHLAATKAEFDENIDSADYRRYDGFVRYQQRRRETEFQLDLGRSRLDFDGGRNVSTTMARATVQWQANPHNRLRLRARRQFADEVQEMVVRLSDPDESLIPDLLDSRSTLVNGGVYRLQAADLDYRYTGERVGLRVRPMYRRLRYIDRVDADRNERSVFFQADYRLRPRTDVFVSAFFRKREFQVGDQTDEDRVYRVGFEHQLSRHWGWRAEALRNERDSNISDARYDENAVLLTVWWKR